jgi:hypothetical protein
MECLQNSFWANLFSVRDFQEINYPNKRTTENTEKGEIKRVCGSVLGHFFIWKSLIPILYEDAQNIKRTAKYAKNRELLI